MRQDFGAHKAHKKRSENSGEYLTMHLKSELIGVDKKKTTENDKGLRLS